MKQKPVIFLSLVGALLFIGIQVVVLLRNYTVQEENFKTKYANQIKEALYQIRQENNAFGFHNTWKLVDRISYNFIEDYIYLTKEERQGADSAFIVQIEKLLQKNDQISELLRESLIKEGLNSEFDAFFNIQEFYLIDYDNNYLLLKKQEEIEKGAYFIQPYVISTERNNFRIKLNYYVEFKEQKNLIIKEMTSMISLLILSSFLVFGIFIFTLNRYLKQKRLSDLKTDFINNITHELKTPLATISLAASSLQNEKFQASSEKINELAEMIKRQNRQLSGLVDNVLEASISGNKKIASNKKQEQLNKLCEEIVTDYYEGHKEKCSINFTGSDELELAIDKLAFSTMITNLLDNSIKYSEKKASIEVSIKRTKNDATICVKDQGIGIPSTYKTKVFEEFIRIPNNSQRKIKGFGLGLYTVKRIAEEHNGSVWIESEEGKGTSVFIKLLTHN